MRHRVGGSYWLLLLVLAAIWGASYLFIKLPVRDLEPTVTMCARSLLPGFALGYGAILLDEPVTASAVGGLALILAGVTLGSGALRRFERPTASAPAQGR